jgi:Xaa-Pro aminopeptidase
VSTEHHELRRTRLLELLAADDLDAMLVTAPVNVRYLTGFTGSNGAVLLTRDGTVLATDGRYVEQSRHETGLGDIVVTRDILPSLIRAARERHASVVAVERAHVTLAMYDDMSVSADVAGAEASGRIELAPRSGLVERLRTVKDDVELLGLERAAAIADRAWADVQHLVRPGVTERQLAIAVEENMRRHGADGAAFATIVAAGPNGSQPHHVPADYAFRDGDLVTVDMGARVDGYHSDMTRTVAVGTPAAWQRELHELVAEAQRRGRQAAIPGRPVADIDHAARSVIAAAGHAEAFMHGVGHGVGLQIHEAPMLFATATEILEPGMVVTVEPGVYLAGRGGVRIEDTIVVTADGHRVITTASYSL